jgi:hypothetical protein
MTYSQFSPCVPAAVDAGTGGCYIRLPVYVVQGLTTFNGSQDSQLGHATKGAFTYLLAYGATSEYARLFTVLPVLTALYKKIE